MFPPCLLMRNTRAFRSFWPKGTAVTRHCCYEVASPKIWWQLRLVYGWSRANGRRFLGLLSAKRGLYSPPRNLRSLPSLFPGQDCRIPRHRRRDAGATWPCGVACHGSPRWRPVQPRLVAYPADPSGHRAAGSSRVRKGHGAEQWMLFIACHSLA
jgi:hypothetical protein